ncbi:MAG: hypothetical protein PWP24_910 [Clostridiales bacterium]|nr:hypothetical protein [Clostridiales bacterium]
MQDVIIVGAGAAGLVAAVLLSRENINVTLLEHNDKIGRKLLATGNGKCNFTNDVQVKECYRGENPDFAWQLIERYGKNEFLLFLNSLGILPKNKQGYYYPYSEQAASIVDALLTELSHQRVKIKCLEHVVNIKQDTGGFTVQTKTYAYRANQVILACGGMAMPSLGSDGSGYALAKKLGHKVTDLQPAMTGLRVGQKGFDCLAGIRIKAELTLSIDGKVKTHEQGELQFTAYGISGIPVFQVSRYATMALMQQKTVSVQLALLPALTKESLVQYIGQQKKTNGYKTRLQVLQNLMDPKLAKELLKLVGLRSDGALSTTSSEEIRLLVNQIKQYTLPIKGSNGFEQAQVTAGGVDTRQLSPGTLESLICENLYLIGELVDVDGTCGGYNLQWAYTSAKAATDAILQKVRHRNEEV